MGSRHDPGVLERNAEIEDVGVRVERIVRRVNNFGTSKVTYCSTLTSTPPEVSHGK